MTEVVLPLTTSDLTLEDLPSCTWSGSATHRAHIAKALERVPLGEVDFLTACPPSGIPVGMCAVDYVKSPGAGTLWMVEVHAALRSCGIGTLLIEAAEQRIHARGVHRAELGVEKSNPRARALYERLGYVEFGEEEAGWDAEGLMGSSAVTKLSAR